VTYFTNPAYPATETALSFCTYSISVKDADICQLRYVTSAS
jgi:hypothetical protein